LPPHVSRRPPETASAESLLSLCAGVRSARAHGAAAISCQFFAQNGFAAARNTRRGRPPCLLGDVYENPACVLAAGGPGPVEELETREFLAGLLANLPDDRLRRIVNLRAEGLTMAEVAARVRLSRQRVEQLLQRARRLVCLGRDGSRT
jgi:hypothetical protein